MVLYLSSVKFVDSLCKHCDIVLCFESIFVEEEVKSSFSVCGLADTDSGIMLVQELLELRLNEGLTPVRYKMVHFDKAILVIIFQQLQGMLSILVLIKWQVVKLLELEK